jgi:hypothetical protein
LGGAPWSNVIGVGCVDAAKVDGINVGDAGETAGRMFDISTRVGGLLAGTV